MLRVVIVGDGPLRAELEAFAAVLGLANRAVVFLGERSDVSAVIQTYDAFLLTSLIEGMPNVVMESQLVGVPVIATRAGGTVDLIRHGETGLLGGIGDFEGLAAALVRLLTDKPLREKISRAAQDQIRGDFTAELLVRRTETLYRHLLGNYQSVRGAQCAE
jgi:glycosyltransferase involved in cell wall biosynthesis